MICAEFCEKSTFIFMIFIKYNGLGVKLFVLAIIPFSLIDTVALGNVWSFKA